MNIMSTIARCPMKKTIMALGIAAAAAGAVALPKAVKCENNLEYKKEVDSSVFIRTSELDTKKQKEFTDKIVTSMRDSIENNGGEYRLQITDPLYERGYKNGSLWALDRVCLEDLNKIKNGEYRMTDCHPPAFVRNAKALLQLPSSLVVEADFR